MKKRQNLVADGEAIQTTMYRGAEQWLDWSIPALAGSP